MRKHLSRVLGGNLAKIAYPATVVALVFSDVLGDDVSFIASGPFVKDTTTKADAIEILTKYGLSPEDGSLSFEVLETPKEDEYFTKVSHLLLVNNARALTAMAERARALGYETQILDYALGGEAREVGEHLARHAPAGKGAHLFGGETTVTVAGSGDGGRNLELSMGALRVLAPGSLVVSLASDGRDNCQLAGGIADAQTIADAQAKGLDVDAHLKNNDSLKFWIAVGSGIDTGRTGMNVADLVLVMHS